MTHARITAATLAFLATLPPAAVAEDLTSQIVGMWRYVSVTRTEVASGKVIKPYGENPKGYLVYTKGGLGMFVLVAENRAKPAAAAVTDAEAAALYRTMAAGSATYKVEGKTVIATWDTMSNQASTGTTQKRYFDIVGNTLTIWSDPVKTSDGLEVVLKNTLEKVE